MGILLKDPVSLFFSIELLDDDQQIRVATHAEPKTREPTRRVVATILDNLNEKIGHHH